MNQTELIRIKLEILKEIRSIRNQAKTHVDKFCSVGEAYDTFLQLRIDRLEEEIEDMVRIHRRL
jgi:hypothetical protein